ncbi:MAG: site-2 protease family protein [Clostridium sp.]|uniref:site-2 protease family protein n=1 Tax=Clostridium sp. TaxID=1506 RepID=UPI0030524B32
MIRINKYFIPYIILILIVGFKSKLTIGFIIIMIHEGIHLITARILGYSGFSIDIFPMGTSLKFKELEEASPKDDIIISLSGPIGNFLIAIVSYFIGKYYSISCLIEFGNYNLVIGIFNLIPAFPLDGGRILRSLLNLKLIFKKANKVSLNISIVIGYIFGGLFLIAAYKGDLNVNLAFFSVFILTISYREKRRIAYIIMGYIIKKKEKFIRRGYLENKNMSVYYKLNILQVIELIDKNKYNVFTVLDDDMNVLGILYEEDILNGIKELGNITLEELLES